MTPGADLLFDPVGNLLNNPASGVPRVVLGAGDSLRDAGFGPGIEADSDTGGGMVFAINALTI